MALSDTIASAILTAKNATADLRVTVVHTPMTGRDGYGRTYGAAVPRKAIVEDLSEVRNAADGTVTVTLSKVTILEPISMTEGDKVKLPAALGKPARELLVVRHRALLKPNGVPYMTEAWLGENA
jgi:hypothetical protein